MRPDFRGVRGACPLRERGAVRAERPCLRLEGAKGIGGHASVASVSTEAPSGRKPNTGGIRARPECWPRACLYGIWNAGARGSASPAAVFKAGGSLGPREARERSERVYGGPKRKGAEHGLGASAPRASAEGAHACTRAYGCA